MRNKRQTNKSPLVLILLLVAAVFLIIHAAHGQTNDVTAAPVTAGANDTFNWLVTWNNKLLGAPSGVLVVVLLFLFDSVLYYAEFFPNRNIPVFSIVVGGLIYSLICVRPVDASLPLRVWVVKNIVLGCIFGAAAWIGSLRYCMKLVLIVAGKPDPSPPLPPPAAPPAQKIEVEIVNPPKP